jgi:GWxTD domain-containing protein
MKTKHLIGVAVLCFAAVAAFAGGLSKYKGWDKTPQGYLMTAAERAQWASVKTDDEADKFVKDFLARRSPNFAEQVNQAAAAADKYFTTDKTPGSRTERGRLVIILGPPSAMSKNDTPVRGALRSPSAGALSNANGGGGGETSGGGSTEDYLDAANNAGAADSMLHSYSFTYDAKRLPPQFDHTLTVAIAVEPSGRERIDRKTQAELDRVYEMAAQLRLVQPSTR